MSFKHIWARKGFRQFLIKTGLLVGITLILPIIMFPFLELSRYNKSNPDPLGKLFLVDIGIAVLITILAFSLIARDKLLKLKEYKYSKKQGFSFSITTLLLLLSYLVIRYFTANNPAITIQYHWLFSWTILLNVFLIFVFMALAIFNPLFIRYFFKNFKKELLFSSILVGISYFFILKARLYWYLLGKFVASSVALLLRLSFKDVILNIDGNRFTLGVKGFIANIGAVCSGIESLAMFLLLYILIFTYDYKIINKKRMLLILIPGLIGTVFTNILRIYLLYLSAIFISPAFAVGLFHSNAGWLLFIAYFVGFWWFAYPWVKRDDILKKH